jgi:hypothetical protein
LRHALEITGDGRGDDDGLCESNEACIVAPTIGMYQGEGSLVSGCTFTNGTVRDVELSWWSSLSAM